VDALTGAGGADRPTGRGRAVEISASDDRETVPQIRTKLEWEAASEKLGNLLAPPLPRLPDATPENLWTCFERMQESLDALRAAYDVPPGKG
jgi:hypothetical protein